jgi:hypothetical protein
MNEAKEEDSLKKDVDAQGLNEPQSAEKNISWLPDNKVSLMSFLFLFFVGFYGIFMVSISWILYWFFALFFSPKVIHMVLNIVSKRQKQ